MHGRGRSSPPPGASVGHEILHTAPCRAGPEHGLLVLAVLAELGGPTAKLLSRVRVL